SSAYKQPRPGAPTPALNRKSPIRSGSGHAREAPRLRRGAERGGVGGPFGAPHVSQSNTPVAGGQRPRIEGADELGSGEVLGAEGGGLHGGEQPALHALGGPACGQILDATLGRPLATGALGLHLLLCLLLGCHGASPRTSVNNAAAVVLSTSDGR